MGEYKPCGDSASITAAAPRVSRDLHFIAKASGWAGDRQLACRFCRRALPGGPPPQQELSAARRHAGCYLYDSVIEGSDGRLDGTT
jgi:hypothetical protein